MLFFLVISSILCMASGKPTLSHHEKKPFSAVLVLEESSRGKALRDGCKLNLFGLCVEVKMILVDVPGEMLSDPQLVQAVLDNAEQPSKPESNFRRKYSNTPFKALLVLREIPHSNALRDGCDINILGICMEAVVVGIGIEADGKDKLGKTATGGAPSSARNNNLRYKDPTRSMCIMTKSGEICYEK